jgi:hypothetical protein
VAERFKAAVLKTAVRASAPWVRIPPHPPYVGIAPAARNLGLFKSLSDRVDSRDEDAMSRTTAIARTDHTAPEPHVLVAGDHDGARFEAGCSATFIRKPTEPRFMP